MYCESNYSFEGREIKMMITEPGCWIPVGRSKDKDGYIWFWFRGKMTRLHRAIYIFLHGELPSQIHVRHICDNPACFNPAHLIEGTAQDDADDKKRHGRQIYGEQIGIAKLTEAKVEAILKSNAPIKTLAEEYDVSESTIGSIINGQTWKQVDRPANSPRLNRAPDKPSIMGARSKTKLQEIKQSNNK